MIFQNFEIQIVWIGKRTTIWKYYSKFIEEWNTWRVNFWLVNIGKEQFENIQFQAIDHKWTPDKIRNNNWL